MDTEEKPKPSQPSCHLYMDAETAMHRIKALFLAIVATASDSHTVTDLASLGADVVQDQIEMNKQA